MMGRAARHAAESLMLRFRHLLYLAFFLPSSLASLCAQTVIAEDGWVWTHNLSADEQVTICDFEGSTNSLKFATVGVERPDVSIPVNRPGLESITRVEVGPDHEVFIVSGYDSQRAEGYIRVISHSSWVFSGWSEALEWPFRIQGTVYLEERDELWFLSSSVSSLVYGAFDAANPPPTISPRAFSVDLSIFPSPSDAWLAESEAAALRIYSSSSGDTPYVDVSVTDDGQGNPSVSLSPAAPTTREVRFEGDLLINTPQALVRGPSLASVEVFREVDGLVVGSAVLDSQGEATVNLSPLNYGYSYGLRELGGTATSFGHPFRTYGTSESTTDNLVLHRLGASLSLLAYDGNEDFRVAMTGTGPSDGVERSIAAVLLVGVESDVLEFQPGRFALIGPSVIPFGAIGTKAATGSLLADVDMPVVAEHSLAGGQVCFQWVLQDEVTGGFVYSNIAAIQILQRRWIHPRYRTQFLGSGPSVPDTSPASPQDVCNWAAYCAH